MFTFGMHLKALLDYLKLITVFACYLLAFREPMPILSFVFFLVDNLATLILDHLQQGNYAYVYLCYLIKT